MPKASLLAFCHPEELQGWIRSLCEQFGLGSLSFSRSNQYGRSGPDCATFKLDPDAHSIFLFPESTPPAVDIQMNDVDARGSGWLTIRPGQQRSVEGKTVLFLSELYGEDLDYESVHPARFLRWLKRQLNATLMSGVTGCNTVNGGKSLYHDIRYTKRAFDLFRSGVAWKQEATATRIVFEPAGKESKV